MRTIVLTGAGISKSAGIPTFEEFPQLREVLKLSYFEQCYNDFWNVLKYLKTTIKDKKPTTAHKLLAGKQDWLIVTMNIDSLHKKAGTEKLYEIHGNLEEVTCTKCLKKYDFNVAYDSIYCKECGGRLKPSVALYGEDVPLYKTIMKEIKLYNNVIIIGTSFKTCFASDFKTAAEKLGKNIKIFNKNADVELSEYLIDLETSLF